MCECLDKVNTLLAEQNAELLTTFGFGGLPRRPVIETVKLESKKRTKSPRMVASYCPFCGDKYAVTSQDGAPA